MALITMIGNVLTEVIGWFGTVLDALLGTASESGGTAGSLGVLMPILCIGIVISLVLLTAKVIRRYSWGA